MWTQNLQKRSMASLAIPSVHFHLLILLVLLLGPRLSNSSSYTTHGGKHFVLRSSSDARRPSQTASYCSTVPHGDGGRMARNSLPVVHRLSPCSPLGADRLSVLHLDKTRLRMLTYSPVTGNPPVAIPGPSEAEYHVVIGYGTPAQKLTVGFNNGVGEDTLLQCKPCGGTTCDIRAFDPSQSSSFAQVPCGSPGCPLQTCSNPNCTFIFATHKGVVLSSTTFVTDTLTFSQSTPTTVENFRVACQEMGASTAGRSSGILDLSRNSHSLASRALSSPDTLAFSYCLPSEMAVGQGFLSIGAPRPEGNLSYATLQNSAAYPNLYLVRLAGLDLGVGGPGVPIPPGDALITLHTTFTFLRPEAYAALRDQFKAQMTRYRAAPPMGFLDTCYDFTGLRAFSVPVVKLRFTGGASMLLGIPNMMYFWEQDNYFSVGCLAFASPAVAFPSGISAVIGTLAHEGTEMVYDVRGEKIGFIPNRCCANCKDQLIESPSLR